MSLTLPKTWAAGDILTAADLNTQFDAVEAKFSGAILGTEITAATIPNSALVYDDYEFLVNLSIQGLESDGTPPTADAAVPLAICGIPGSTTDGTSYTVLSANAAMRDSGDVAAATTFKVCWGYFNNTTGGGAWTDISTVIASGGTGGNLVSLTANGQVCSIPALTTTALSLADSPVTRHLGLFLTAVGANALNTEHCFLTVTLKLRRTSGLR